MRVEAAVGKPGGAAGATPASAFVVIRGFALGAESEYLATRVAGGASGAGEADGASDRGIAGGAGGAAVFGSTGPVPKRPKRASTEGASAGRVVRPGEASLRLG